MNKETNEPKPKKLVLQCSECGAKNDDLNVVLEAEETHHVSEVQGCDVFVSCGDTAYGGMFMYCQICGHEWPVPHNANLAWG